MAVVAVSATLNDPVASRRRNVFEDLERGAIAQALEASGGNITEAAARLGIWRQTLQRKMTKLGMR